jgi:hypothetical protein
LAQPELFVTVSNMGFFTEAREPDGGRVLQIGEGTLVATQFVGDVLQLSLAGPNGAGRVDVKLPGGLGGPTLSNNARVRVEVAAQRDGDKTWRGVTVRSEARELLFAADPALGSPALTAADLAPYAVTLEDEGVGCRLDAVCGKFVFANQALSNGTASVSVAPGKLGSLGSGTQAMRLWNVTAGRYGASSRCASYRPYALWREPR